MAKDHPIIFSSEMVRAILDGRKTQTRRVITEKDCWRNDLSKKHNIVSLADAYPVKDKSYLRVPFRHKDDPDDIPWSDEGSWRIDPLWQAGDRLWVRETQWRNGGWVADGPSPLRHDSKIPSIFMKKIYARIFLEITNIRVERVQDISVADCLKEGISEYPKYSPIDEAGFVAHKIQDEFAELWDSLNAKRGYGWDKNPWVWVIQFRRGQENGS
jgi:hypothetical protein